MVETMMLNFKLSKKALDILSPTVVSVGRKQPPRVRRN